MWRGTKSPLWGACSAIALSICTATPTALAGPPEGGDPADIEDPNHGTVKVGPLHTREDGRDRVRGNRSENASVHVAFVPPAHQPDEDLLRALAAFEGERFPEGTAPTTIVDEPPEPWLAKLTLPKGLPIRWNAKTVEYLHYFRDDPKGQRLLAGWVRRMGRYGDRVEEILDETGVPPALTFVAMTESGFRPDVRSRVGAGGMWQFMEATGRVYGLNAEYWSDDRFDFERSTYAAATYLSDLHTRFGSWELALAAYNAGYGLVMKAIKRHNTNNYWALCEIESGLPYATTNYIPKIIAAAIATQNPEVFGLDTLKPLEPARLVEAMVPPATRIEDIAAAIGEDANTLAEFNARWIRGRTPAKGGPYPVWIRTEHLAALEGAESKLRASVQRFSSYEMQLGEHISQVADRFGITERRLRSINGVRDSAELGPGVVIVVPAPDGHAPTSSTPPLVAVPPLDVPAGKRVVYFRVTRASTPRRIADAFESAWSDVVLWNDLDPKARLQDGQFLQLVVPQDFDAKTRGVRVFDPSEVNAVVRGTQAHLEAELDSRELQRRGYKVRGGEKLKTIARRFDLSLGSLCRINALKRSHTPEKGDILVVYVGKGKTRGTVKAPAPKATTLTAELAEVETLARPTARSPSTPETSRLPGKDND